MTDNTTKHWYRSVRVKMTPKQVSEYQVYHRGLDINFYAPQFEDKRMYDMKQAINAITYYDVTITASSINPNVLHERTEQDIDEELAIIDSKYGILQDHLTQNDNKDLIHAHQSKESLTKHGTIMSHPYLDEHDHLRSKAQDVHKIIIPMKDIKDFENHVERRKAFYRKAKLDYVKMLDMTTGEQTAEIDFGYISG